MKKNLLLLALMLQGVASMAQTYGYGLNYTGGVVKYTGGDNMDSKGIGAAGNNTTDDASVLQGAITPAGFGTALNIVGRSRLGSGLTLKNGFSLRGMGTLIDYTGFRSDSTFRGTSVLAKSGNNIQNLSFISQNLIAANDTLQIAFQIKEPDNQLTLENVAVFGYSVGLKIQSYYHNIKNVRVDRANYGFWLRGRPNPAYSYTGALEVTGVLAKNCQLAGIFADGYVSTTTISGAVLENNRTHIWNKGGTLNIYNVYAGDNQRYGIRNDGGTLVVHNDNVRPIAGAGGFTNSGETPRTSSYDGAGVYVSAGKVVLDNVSLNNSVWFNTGYTGVTWNGTTYGLGQNRGSALYVAAGAEIEMLGHVKSNVAFPFRGTGKITGRKINNYIENGSFSDTLRLGQTINVSGLSNFYQNPTPLGGYVVTLNGTSGGIYYEVPETYVGKTMYLCVLNYGITGSTFSILDPGINTGYGRDSEGWTMVGTSNPTYPWQGVAGRVSDRANIIGADFSDQPVMDWIPVTITKARGSFSLYSPGVTKLGGVWLTEAENFGEIGAFRDVVVDNSTAVFNVADQSISGSATNATRLSFYATANTTYVVDATLLVQASAATAAAQLAFDVPTNCSTTLSSPYPSSTNGSETIFATGDDVFTTQTTTAAGSTTYLLPVKAVIAVGNTAGTVQLRVKAGGSSGTVSVLNNSELRWRVLK